MSEIIIKNESDPKRCEVCHKTDLYDPPTNFCQRCNESQIYIPEPVKTTCNLVNPDEDDILEAMKKESATLKSRHQEQVAAKQKEDLVIKAAARRKDITEWRIKNRKAYRELLDRLLSFAFPDIEQGVLAARPFAEKLVLSKRLFEMALKKIFLDIGCSLLIIMLGWRMYCQFSPVFFYISAIFQLCVSVVWVGLSFALPLPLRSLLEFRSLRFCFYYLYWNRKVNGEEVYFDSSVNVIRKEHSGSTELSVYPK